jgi:hypothetical protein
MAPKRLERNLTLLDLLSKTTKAQREALIKTSTQDQLQCICDCAANILKENIHLTDEQFKRLKRFQKHLRYLADSSDNLENKRLVIQNGGFLPILLTPILSAAASILTDTLLNKK